MITIDLDSQEPLFNQLITQIKQAIAGHILHPGDPLPSIRQLANELDINAKTVAKAYRLLERDNVIESKGYRGSFVHLNAKDNLKTNIKDWLAKELVNDVARYRSAGATNSEIRIAFAEALAAYTK